MVRKRDQLLQLLSDHNNSGGSLNVTATDASQALRECNGNLDEAYRKILSSSSSSSMTARAATTKTTTVATTKHHHQENSIMSFSNSSGNSNDNDRKPSSITAASTRTTSTSNNTSTAAAADFTSTNVSDDHMARRPPEHSVRVNNLSDEQYCCVWWVEVFDDGYRPDIARDLLAKVARHINPILRARGWRVKRLIESCSTKAVGSCHTNGRGDADAASANIQLNLRVEPNKTCRRFRSFKQILGVMLHEITHISIGLEDIHPPAFWELLAEIKQQYLGALADGRVAKETETYGGSPVGGDVGSGSGSGTNNNTSSSGTTNSSTTIEVLQNGDECGARKGRGRRAGKYKNNAKRTAGKALGIKAQQQSEKRRPLLKGVKMIDKRTKEGKASVAAQQNMTPRELAAQAAMERLGQQSSTTTTTTTTRTTSTASASTSTSTNLATGRSDDTSSDEDNHTSGPGRSNEIIDLLDDDDDDDDDEEEDDVLDDHQVSCGCRACRWDKMLSTEIVSGFRDWS